MSVSITCTTAQCHDNSCIDICAKACAEAEAHLGSFDCNVYGEGTDMENVDVRCQCATDIDWAAISLMTSSGLAAIALLVTIVYCWRRRRRTEMVTI